MDNAVAHFGTALESELEAVEGKNSRAINKKRERIMTRWLDLPQKFRSPAVSKRDVDNEQEFTVQGDVL